jgi:hypothetical protein
VEKFSAGLRANPAAVLNNENSNVGLRANPAGVLNNENSNDGLRANPAGVKYNIRSESKEKEADLNDDLEDENMSPALNPPLPESEQRKGIRLLKNGVKIRNEKSAVAERTIQMLEKELVKLSPGNNPINRNILVKATNQLNNRIRQLHKSARELLFRRNQLSGEALHENDTEVADKHGRRKKNNNKKFTKDDRKEKEKLNYKLGDKALPDFQLRTKKKVERQNNEVQCKDTDSEKECFYCKRIGYLDFKHEKEQCRRYKAVAPQKVQLRTSENNMDSDDDDLDEIKTCSRILHKEILIDQDGEFNIDDEQNINEDEKNTRLPEPQDFREIQRKRRILLIFVDVLLIIYVEFSILVY